MNNVLSRAVSEVSVHSLWNACVKFHTGVSRYFGLGYPVYHFLVLVEGGMICRRLIYSEDHPDPCDREHF